ncbi:AcrB/AcrD/AcrF family protein [Amycolatopsis balhimycina DSM 5908]|uniref:AcrB/AcrD/AcrF family protein n=1 Tax=Amycolatopsis balhimycina DSM 5908 TaxID=1081091 RepID=A0A428WZ02_AMYBA|nr:efflux RND transporter permease subunit [Amycolatopsis balhimycina]RSM48247.1 AcrB/AcrD/AcrF family protein [Amycolatopsis balhimycina DSM 5908]
MTRWIVGQSLKLRLLVLVGAAALLVFGGIQLRTTSLDTLPEFSPTSVEVQTEALGLSAAEVEQLITVPLEADLLNGIAWLKTIRSESVPGLSSLTLVFEQGTDPLKARQVVQERITQAKALPNVSKPPIMLEPLSSSSRVMMIGLTPKQLSLIDTSVLARWTIKPRLMGVPGVANVSIWGQRDQQLQVQVDPKKLAASDVSLAQVIQTAGNAMWVSPLTFLEASTPGSGGFFDTNNQRLGIQHVSPIASAEDLAKVTVEDTPNRIVKLGDVTTVVKDHQPLIGDAAVQSGPSLILVVEKFPGADTMSVSRGLDQAIEDLRPGLGGVRVDTGVFRPAMFLDAAIGNVGLWLLIGGILLLAVFALTLRSWRGVLAGVVSLLVSLAAGAGVLTLAGATINLLTVAGLVVAAGLVVDDILIDLREIRHGLAAEGKTRAELVLDASLAVRGSAIFATVIGLLVPIPVFFLDGQAKTFYLPLVLAYGAAVLASLVVALTLTPVLGVLLMRPGRPVARPAGPGARYVRFLSRALAHPRRILAGALVLLVAGIGFFPLVTQSLLPTAKDPDVLVQFNGPSGTSLPEMDRITARAGDELRRIGGVQTVAVQVGRAVLADQVVGTNSSQLWVTLTPGVDYDTALAAVRRTVSSYPGIKSQVQTYGESRASEILATSTNEVTVRLYGQDIDILKHKAGEVATMLAGVTGIVAPRVETQDEEPMMLVDVNLAAAERFGIKPGDVRREAATLVNGTEVGSLYEGQKIFEVVVRGTPATRTSLSGIRDLSIDTPGGGHVRLGDVANITVGSKPTVIKREDVSRRIDVTASVSGRSVSSVSADVQGKLKDISFPLEYHAALLGSYSDHQAALGELLAVAIAAAIGIFLLLQAAFSSWRLAAVTFVALPFALTGGLVTTVLADGELSLGSLAGFLLVTGLATRGTVALVRRYRRLRDEGTGFGPSLVVRGAHDVLGGVLATAGAIAAFFLPVLFFGTAAGLEIVHPMAVNVLGGLVTSTVLVALVVPALYLVFAGRRTERVDDTAFTEEPPEASTVDTPTESPA